jgi:PAS domain S-box-containing protein
MESADNTRVKSLLIETFKSFAFLIFEVSKEEIITAVWAKDPVTEAAMQPRFLNKRLADIRNDNVINVGIETTRKVFATGEAGVVAYQAVMNEGPVKIITRILPDVTDKNKVFHVIEKENEQARTEVIEDKWQMALDAAGDGMWDANLENNKIFFSEKWHELFGYAPEEMVTGDVWGAKIHPDDLLLARKEADEYLSGKKSNYSIELRCRCKDGNYKWILSRGIIAARSKDGKPTRFIGTHTDIHQRKLNEQALAKSEARFRIIFDYSEAMICTHDVEGNIISVNPFTRKTLGYTDDELVGRPLISLIPERHHARFNAEYLDEVNNKGKAEGIMSINCKNGDRKYLLFHNYLFNEKDEAPYIIGFAQDITERIKAERALKDSMDTFAGAFMHSGVGIALRSPQGKWLDVNNALCEITGYSREELLSKTFEDITHPDDVAGDHEAMKRILAKEIDSYTREKRYISKSGKIVWISLTVSLVWNRNDTPKFFIAQIVDITQKKQLLDELNHKNAELEETQQSLINKISQLEELSYIIAHNLRGPANNIRLLAETLKVKYGIDSQNEEALIMSDAVTEEEAASMIGDAGGALLGSLELLLALAQIRLNTKIPYEDCNVKGIIDRIVAQLYGTIIEKRADIKLDLKASKVFYPSVYLENIIYNLVSNALKYSNPSVKPQIVVTTQETGNKTILSVKDNGLGIDMSKHGQKLFKLNQVFHNNKDGKGIGLYLIKTQIESLGGSISLASKVNEGSEFTVQL